MKSIMGKIVDARAYHQFARVCRATGWRGGKGRPRFTGVHKCLPKADLRALALRLQREASR